MLDLVGNPNCWFSHAQAHIEELDNGKLFGLKMSIVSVLFCLLPFKEMIT